MYQIKKENPEPWIIPWHIRDNIQRKMLKKVITISIFILLHAKSLWDVSSPISHPFSKFYANLQ